MKYVISNNHPSYKINIFFVATAFVVLLITPSITQGQGLLDSDGDNLSDYDELLKYHTNPFMRDTDNDGFDDGDEINRGFSPRHGDMQKLIAVDSDKDYLNDAWELALGTGLMDPDSDGDLYLDGTEVAASYDPLDPRPVTVDKVIMVDLKKQQLEYRFGDVVFGSFPISSGLRYTPTPTGNFSILGKYPLINYGGSNYYYPNTKWNLHFTTQRGRFFIHGTYWHNDFGQQKSHGCVNVSYENMEPLYWWSQRGTRLEIR